MWTSEFLIVDQSVKSYRISRKLTEMNIVSVKWTRSRFEFTKDKCVDFCDFLLL